MKKKGLPEVESVHLKELWGMKPGKWLFILYLFGFVLLLFVFGILPDLFNSYKRVYFSSNAFNAAVYVDGNYAGGTPFSKKIKSGSHEVVFKVNDVEIDRMNIFVSHPVFFNWLYPRKMKVYSNAVLNEQAYNALTAEFFEDLVSYSAVTNYDNVFYYPPLYTNYVKSVLSSPFLYENILSLSALFITNEIMLEDARTAFTLAGFDYDFSSEQQNVPLKMISSEMSKLFLDNITIDGYLINNSFTISKEEISEYLYSLFLDENPSWSTELTEKRKSEVKPITNINFKEARAFCEWLSEKTGRMVSLPTVYQWETASQFADQKFQKTLISVSSYDGPVSMFGGVWEMTSSFYVPCVEYSEFSEIQNILEKLDIDAEISVKGGSFLNSGIDMKTVGTASQDTKSSYMGFRIIWQ